MPEQEDNAAPTQEEIDTAAAAIDSDEDEQDEPLRPEGQRALERIKKEREELKARIAKYEAQEKELEDAKLSETERHQKAASEYLTRAEKAEQALTRMEVAAKYGLTPNQAKRLVGSTAEELEADAQELLEDLAKPADSLPSRPKPRLRGGSTPDEPADPSPKDIVDQIRSRRR